MIYIFTPNNLEVWNIEHIFTLQSLDMLPEFKSILDLIKAFPTEQSCIEHLEGLRWEGVVVSPFDENSKVYK